MRDWWNDLSGVGKTAVVVGALVAVGAVGSFGDDEPEAEPAVADEPDPEPDEPADDPEPEPETEDPEPVDDEPEPEPEEPERPDIDSDYLALTEDHLAEETVVNDTHVEVDDDTVVIALEVGAATDPDAAKRFLDNGARFLAMLVAGDHDELDGPSGDHLGDLWDHYSLRVVAGSDPDDPMVRGALSQGARSITW